MRANQSIEPGCAGTPRRTIRPPSARTVAKLGHGGILTRSQRFRFPAYARELDAPEG